MIQPTTFCRQLSELAAEQGFTQSILGEVASYPILAFSRNAQNPARSNFRLYLSSGVHGDEPAGPLALEQLLRQGLLPTDIDIVLIPFINPTGFEAQTRENANGHDLNRDFRRPTNTETKAIQQFLAKEAPFDLSISLHEDWESSGFYLYALSPNSDESIPRKILAAAATVGPIDLSSQIDESPATDGLINRPAEFDIEGRDDWPEAFLLYSKSNHYHFTTETPSSLPIETRIAMHTTTTMQAIELVRATQHPNTPIN